LSPLPPANSVFERDKVLPMCLANLSPMSLVAQ
jgi:hypothetical protein